MGRKNKEEGRRGRSIAEAFQAGSSSKAKPHTAPPHPPRSSFRSRSRSRDASSDSSRSNSPDSVVMGVLPLPKSPLKGSKIPLKSSHIALVQYMEESMRTALQEARQQMTADLNKEIHALCSRTATLETQCDTVQMGLKEATSDIKLLQEENTALQLKIEDLENRSRRSNLRFRGIPESVTDVADFILRLSRDLQPTLSADRLELERAHRALTRKNPSGPPRDIVVKYHFYRSKEAVLAAARERSKSGPLSFEGHHFQIFADLAPSTIQRRREMKPALTILQEKGILYRWGFPFKVIFSYQGKYHTMSSPGQASDLFKQLGLSQEHPASTPLSTTSSATKRSRSPKNTLEPDVLDSPDGKQPMRRHD